MAVWELQLQAYSGSDYGDGGRRGFNPVLHLTLARLFAEFLEYPLAVLALRPFMARLLNHCLKQTSLQHPSGNCSVNTLRRIIFPQPDVP